MNIFTSASKLGFILLIFTSCVGFIIGKLQVDQFMLLATGASAFYFTQKGNSQAFGLRGK